MTNEQIERLIHIADRYVTVEEVKLQLAREVSERRQALEERAVAAQEHASKGEISIASPLVAQVTHRQANGIAAQSSSDTGGTDGSR